MAYFTQVAFEIQDPHQGPRGTAHLSDPSDGPQSAAIERKRADLSTNRGLRSERAGGGAAGAWITKSTKAEDRISIWRPRPRALCPFRPSQTYNSAPCGRGQTRA